MEPRRKYLRFLVFAAVLLLITASGHFGSKWHMNTHSSVIMNRMMQQAIDVASNLNPHLIKQLHFSEEDVDNPHFKLIRDQLIAFGKIIPQSGIYSMKLIDSLLVFGPESYPANHHYASKPGTVYENPDPRDFEVYLTGRPAVYGPVSDEYGTFISALAPVYDHRTGEVILVVGIDVPLENFREDLLRGRRIIIVAVIFTMIVFLTGSAFYFFRLKAAKTEGIRFRHVETIIIAFVLLFISYLVVLNISKSERERNEQIFANNAMMISNLVREEMLKTEQAIMNLAGFFENQEHVTSDEFESFVAPVLNSTMAKSFHWMPKVPCTLLNQFEGEIQREQIPSYRIQASVCDTESRNPGNGMYFYPILYSMPADHYQTYTGIDMALLPPFEEAIKSSTVTNLNLMMGTPFHDQLQTQTGSFLVLSPVLSTRQNRIMRSLPDKCEAVLGYVAMEIDFADVLQLAFYKHINFSEYLVSELFDLAADESPVFMASSSDHGSHHNTYIPHWHSRREYLSISPVFMFGRAYAIVSHSKPAFHADYPLRNAWIAGVVGLIGVMVFSAITWFWRNQQNILKKTIASRTKQLIERVKELSAIEGINHILNTGEPIDSIMDHVVKNLQKAMQFPESAFCQVELRGMVFSTGNTSDKPDKVFESKIHMFGREIGKIIIENNSEKEVFVEEEKFLGQVAQILGSFLEKKEIERDKEKADHALQDNLESLRHAQRIAGMGSWEFDLVRGITQWSENNYRIMGYEPFEITPTFELFKSRVFPEDIKVIESSFIELQNTLAPITYEFRVKKDDGSVIWLENYVVPVVEGKKIVALKGVNLDITQRKLFEETLIEARRRAEAGDRLKSAFMNNISHEIRTPLNGILGFGQMMAQPGLLESERVEYLKILKTSIDRLINTVTDYMDISLIVSGNLNVNYKDFAMSDLLLGLKQAFAPECQRKGLEFSLIVPPESSKLVVHSDWELLKKALTHLLNNAIKFTNLGSVKFGFGMNEGEIEIFISDTGIGIEKESLERVLNAFVQEDMRISRNYEGSGLGLSIANGIIRKLGGELKLESRKGEGTTARLHIPAAKSETTGQFNPLPEKARKSPTQPLILIAEDDISNYLYLDVLLKKTGMDVLHAKNGSEAVGLCKQHPEINLVLMDIKMPVMDGLEATKEIKQLRPELPIVAITAYAQTGDESRILAAGCDAYLAKPVQMGDLKEMLDKFI